MWWHPPFSARSHSLLSKVVCLHCFPNIGLISQRHLVATTSFTLSLKLFANIFYYKLSTTFILLYELKYWLGSLLLNLEYSTDVCDFKKICRLRRSKTTSSQSLEPCSWSLLTVIRVVKGCWSYKVLVATSRVKMSCLSTRVDLSSVHTFTGRGAAFVGFAGRRRLTPAVDSKQVWPRRTSGYFTSLRSKCVFETTLGVRVPRRSRGRDSVRLTSKRRHVSNFHPFWLVVTLPYVRATVAPLFPGLVRSLYWRGNRPRSLCWRGNPPPRESGPSPCPPTSTQNRSNPLRPNQIRETTYPQFKVNFLVRIYLINSFYLSCVFPVVAGHNEGGVRYRVDRDPPNPYNLRTTKWRDNVESEDPPTRWGSDRQRSARPRRRTLLGTFLCLPLRSVTPTSLTPTSLTCLP